MKESEDSSNSLFKKSLKNDSKYPIVKYFRIERYFTRPLAFLIVKSIVNTSITPNQITVFSFILGIIGGLTFIGGSHIYFIIGGLLIQLSSIFDCADGMLARTKNLCTDYGAYLDLFLDRIADFVFIAGLSIGYYRYSDDLDLFILSLFGISLYFLQVTLFYLTNAFFHKNRKGSAAEERGLFIFFIFFFTMINQIKILTIIFLFATISNNFIKIIQLIKLRKT